MDNIKQGINDASEAVSNSIGNVEQSLNGVASNVSENLKDFGSQTATSISNADFLDTNSIVAKVVFILFIIIVFLILLRVFVYIIGYMFSPNQNPYLVKGMLTGTDPIHISRDPTQANYIVLPRSNNRQTGMEFTWSFWLNLSLVNQTQTSGNNTYMHVFNVGNNTYENTNSETLGIATVNNGPGVYLIHGPGSSQQNKGSMMMHIVMDTESVADVNTINSYVDIDNLPYNKWFHVAIRVENLLMDVYINGVVTQRLVFENTPKQNFNDIYLGQNGGFFGNISNLQYFSRALNVFDINSIVYWGPNTSSHYISGSDNKTKNSKLADYNYMSNNWYFSKMGPDLMKF
jgi:hypothetical protein